MHRALMLDRDLTLRVGEREDPELRDGDVRIAVAAAGLCGSDLHALTTGHWIEYWPATPGHEAVGTVIESASAEVPVGTTVVVDSRIPCHTCSGCEISPRFCTQLTWLGETRPGGFAESLIVKASTVFVVPDGLPTDVAVLAEPLAVVLAALAYPRRTPRTALVLGFGPIGALTALEARRRWPDAALTVIEPNARRRERAQAIGLDVRGSLDELEESTTAFDLVVDAAGYPTSVNDGIARVHTGGTVVILALGTSRISADAADVVEKGVEIVGSIGFESTHVDEALNILAAHTAEFAPCVTNRVILDEAPDFFTSGAHRDSLKVIVVPSAPAVGPHSQEG